MCPHILGCETGQVNEVRGANTGRCKAGPLDKSLVRLRVPSPKRDGLGDSFAVFSRVAGAVITKTGTGRLSPGPLLTGKAAHPENRWCCPRERVGHSPSEPVLGLNIDSR